MKIYPSFFSDELVLVSGDVKIVFAAAVVNDGAVRLESGSGDFIGMVSIEAYAKAWGARV